MPTEYKLYILRGFLYQELSEFPKNKNGYNQKSLEDFNLAEKHIKNYEVYGGRGWSNLLLKNYSDALNDFNIALEKRSEKYFYNDSVYMIPHIYNGRGIVKAKLGDKKGSLEDLKKASKMGDTIATRLYREVENDN